MNAASPQPRSSGSRTGGSRIAEGLLAGLAFGLTDWLASGFARAPVALVAVLLAGALLGGLVAGVLSALARRGAGTALALTLLGVLVLDAAAFGSRELAGQRTAFAVATVALGLAAAVVAARAWPRAPRFAAAACLLGAVPATDLVRRGIEGGTPLHFAACALPLVVAVLVLRLSPRGVRLLALALVGLFAVLGLPESGRAPRPLGPGAPRPAPDAPDVCLIVVDTLRADHVPGPSAPETSAFARLAARGVRFDQAVASAPWTLPSMASLFTSLHPTQHGALTVTRPLPPDVTTLAQRFTAAGYDTAAFTGGAFVSPAYGLDRGFAVFDADAEYRFRPARLHTPLFWQLVRNRWFPQRWLLAHVRAFGGVSEIRKRVLRWLGERDRERPFFLLVHSYEVHDYYLYNPPADDALRDAGPSPFGQRLSVHPDELFGLPQDQLDWFQAVYRARIDNVDRELLLLLDRIEAASERPLVLALTSDHGEGFDVENRRIHHGGRLHDDLLRVPLLLAAPGLAEGRVVNEQVRTLDLGPTLLELARLPAPTDVAGRSLLDALEGKGEWPSPAWSEERGPQRALRTARWKILASDGGRMLHSLDDNPDELPESAVTEERFPAPLLEAWDAFPSLFPPRDVAEQTIDENTRAELRALGYVD